MAQVPQVGKAVAHMHRWLWVTLGVLVAVAVVVLVAGQPVPRDEGSRLEPGQAITVDTYRAAIIQVLGENAEAFSTPAGAERLRTVLLTMDRLPREALWAHLRLTLAADKAKAGDAEGLRATLQELVAQEPWLASSLSPYLSS